MSLDIIPVGVLQDVNKVEETFALYIKIKKKMHFQLKKAYLLVSDSFRVN